MVVGGGVGPGGGTSEGEGVGIRIGVGCTDGRVVVAVDVAVEVLVVFEVFPEHPATNTVANTIVTINMIKSLFFIVIPLFGGKFSSIKCSPYR